MTDVWKEAVIEKCIINCIDWDENDPMKTLNNLISWEVQVALDPTVSEAAQQLIHQGRAEMNDFYYFIDDPDDYI